MLLFLIKILKNITIYFFYTFYDKIKNIIDLILFFTYTNIFYFAGILVFNFSVFYIKIYLKVFFKKFIICYLYIGELYIIIT
jgi:hypothetical protein